MGLFHAQPLPENEVIKGPPDWVARPPNPHRLHHTRVLELVEDHLMGERIWCLLTIGLDAANKVGVGLAEGHHQ